MTQKEPRKMNEYRLHWNTTLWNFRKVGAEEKPAGFHKSQEQKRRRKESEKQMRHTDGARRSLNMSSFVLLLPVSLHPDWTLESAACICLLFLLSNECFHTLIYLNSTDEIAYGMFLNCTHFLRIRFGLWIFDRNTTE